MDKDIIAQKINDGNLVGSKICNIIELLSKNNAVEQKIISKSETSVESVQSYKEMQYITQKIEGNSTPPLIWDINDSFGVLCEVTNSRTEIFTKKNNINSLVEYLNNKYPDDHIVISFRKSSITKSFKRCILFDDTVFNIHTVCELSKICKFWLELGSNKKVFIEMKNGREDFILFVLSCLLAYTKAFSSGEVAMNALIMSNTLKFSFKSLETVKRYIRYYDQMNNLKTTSTFAQKILNQVIITTIPTILKKGEFKPRLKINNVDYPSAKCYFDKNFIVFSDLDIEVNSDVILSLSFVQENRTYHVLDVSFNSFFYQQGLHRFNRFDIETSLPQESIYKFFDQNFYIDLVIFDNTGSLITNPYKMIYDMAEAIRSLTEKYFGDTDEEVYKRLLNEKYDPIVSRVCSQLKLNEVDCKKIQEKFIENAQRSFQCEITAISNLIKADQEVKNYESMLVDEGSKMADIPLIEPHIPINKVLKRAGRGLFSKKKKIDLPIREDLFSIRPLYLTSLSNIENTFFNEVQNLQIKIDFSIFEKYFCETAKTERKPKSTSKKRTELIDSRRLFIVSLCQKQLEMRKIPIEHINIILHSSPEILNQQDLININKIIPNLNEKNLLESAEEASLNQTEQAMLYVSRIPEIREMISILLFEREFFEEICEIEKSVTKTIEVINTLISSNEMKMLFKIILEISNAINYIYGRKKKAIEGFKLESLSQISSYTGTGSYLLLTFIKQSIIKNEISLDEFRRIIREIETIKKDDFQSLRERINNLIIKYTEAVKHYNSIENYEKEEIRKDLENASRKASVIVLKYKELQEKIDLFKEKVGEDTSKTINSILEAIHTFLIKVVNSTIREKV